MSDEHISPARERVLRAAEDLFSARGFSGVTMRDIATALGMRQASLYHHAPGGKEGLFLTVMERAMARHGAGVRQAITDARPDLREQLRAVTSWMLSQPPIDLARLFRYDVPTIADPEAHRLVKMVYTALFNPVEDLLEAAYLRGEIRMVDKKVTTIALFTQIEMIHDIQRYTPTPKDAIASDLIDVVLDGLRRR